MPELGYSVQRNLQSFYENVAKPHRRGLIQSRGGVHYAAYHGPFQMFNAAFLGGLSRHTSSELEARLLRAKRFFETRGLEWCMWTGEDMLGANLLQSLPHLFGSSGLELVNRLPGMHASTLLRTGRRLPAVRVRRVCSNTEREVFCRIISRVFSIPIAWCLELYQPDCLWQGPFRAYLGYAGGDPVCTAAWYWDGANLGIYSVGTLRPFRNKGYAEATLRRMLAEAAIAHPVGSFVLQATDAAQPLYQRLGFTTVTHFQVYASSPRRSLELTPDLRPSLARRPVAAPSFASAY